MVCDPGKFGTTQCSTPGPQFSIVRRSRLYISTILLGRSGIEQPRVALLLIRAALDRMLAEAVSEGTNLAESTPPPEADGVTLMLWRDRNDPVRIIRNLLENSNDWDMLGSLAEQPPSETMNILWPWFVNALEAIANLQDKTRDRPYYAMQYVADFRFEGENELELPEPSITSALRIAIEQIAIHDPDGLRKWVSAASVLEFMPVHRLIAHAFRGAPFVFAADAFDYILADERRLSLGSLEDYTATTTSLVSAIAQLDPSRSQLTSSASEAISLPCRPTLITRTGIGPGVESCAVSAFGCLERCRKTSALGKQRTGSHRRSVLSGTVVWE